MAPSDWFRNKTWSGATGGGRSGGYGFIRLCRGGGRWLSDWFDHKGWLLSGAGLSLGLIGGQRFDVRTHDNSPFRIAQLEEDRGPGQVQPDAPGGEPRG